jgi:phospholipase C
MTRCVRRRSLLPVVALLAACASSPTTASPSVTTSVPPALTASTSSSPAATAAAGTSECSGTAAPARVEHVVWIWMENHETTSVIGTKEAPFETALARRCGTVARYGSVGAPSLPNYLGATSGSTHGVSDDDPPPAHAITTDNLFRQVRRAGGTARSYQEAMPAPCALASSGRYAPKHNPAAYYVGADDRTACQHDDLPLGDLAGGALAADLASGSLATFTFVTPDLCDDTHDCPVATGDAWLARVVTAITSSATYAQGRTALFVVWDEPTPMPFIAVAPWIRPGTAAPGRFDHYALLRATEDLLGLDGHLGAAASAADLRAALVSG